MLKELAKTSEYLEETKDNVQTRHRHSLMLNYFREHKLSGKILDIGENNPFADLLRNELGVAIDNTNVDLDTELFASSKNAHVYDVVLCLDVLEHLFNPLFVLLQFHDVIKKDGKAYISVPRRPKFLWTSVHFHEFDTYRFNLLLKRAGLKINSKIRYSFRRPWFQYFLGVRSFLRLFFENGWLYELTKIEK